MVKVSTKFDKKIIRTVIKHMKWCEILFSCITISIILSICAVMIVLETDGSINKILEVVAFCALIISMWGIVPRVISRDSAGIPESTATCSSLEEDDVCNFTLNDERLIVEYICYDEVIRCDRLKYSDIFKVEETPDFYFIKTEMATYIMDKKTIENDEDYAEVSRLLRKAAVYKVCKK